MTQLSLLEPSRVPVYLTCPACAWTWLSAILHPWGDKTAEQVARRCFCPQCDQSPPMRVADAEPAMTA